jgi:hypothetical protein
MSDVKPFFAPPDQAVRADAWLRQVDGDWEELEDYVEDWDQRTQLRLRCSLEADVELIRTSARLNDGSPLTWSIGWRATDTGLVGEPVLIDFGNPRVDVNLNVPPDRAGATVVLTRRLVLRRDRLAAAATEARYAGSILWSDETPLRLSGRGAAFPTEIIDFEMLNRDRGASWYLDLPASADAPAMGSMILLINAADRDLVAAVSRSRRHSEYQIALIQQMEEGVIEELVRWAIARWDELDHVEDDSVGAAARILAQRVLPEPSGWTAPDVDSMALKAAIVSGARAIGYGRALS